MGFLDCFKYQYSLLLSFQRECGVKDFSSHCDLLSGFTVEFPGRSGSLTEWAGFWVLPQGKTDQGDPEHPDELPALNQPQQC